MNFLVATSTTTLKIGMFMDFERVCASTTILDLTPTISHSNFKHKPEVLNLKSRAIDEKLELELNEEINQRKKADNW